MVTPLHEWKSAIDLFYLCLSRKAISWDIVECFIIHSNSIEIQLTKNVNERDFQYKKCSQFCFIYRTLAVNKSKFLHSKSHTETDALHLALNISILHLDFQFPFIDNICFNANRYSNADIKFINEITFATVFFYLSTFEIDFHPKKKTYAMLHIVRENF